MIGLPYLMVHWTKLVTFFLQILFLNFVKESSPSKYINVRPNDKPWYGSEIRHFSRVRLKRKFNSCKSS